MEASFLTSSSSYSELADIGRTAARRAAGNHPMVKRAAVRTVKTFLRRSGRTNKMERPMKMWIYNYSSKSLSNIFIRHIECTMENISKLLSLFTFDDAVIVCDVERNEHILKEIEEYSNEYITTLPGIELIIFVTKYNCINVIDKILDYSPGSVFVFNKPDVNDWINTHESKLLLPFNTLIKKGKSHFSISLIPEEYEIDISFSIQKYSFKKIMSSLRELN